MLEGLMFGGQIEVRLVVNTIFSMIPHGEFLSVFDKWQCKFSQCIDRGGESFEKTHFYSSIPFALEIFIK
jgi:hypothetical protein